MNSKISPREKVLADAQKRLEKDITDYIDECMKKDHPKSFLIAVLHKVQEKYGYLSKENLQAVAYL
nr:hypothetical protein [Candidatus Anoxychlamydiales bacterium]